MKKRWERREGKQKGRRKEKERKSICSQNVIEKHGKEVGKEEREAGGGTTKRRVCRHNGRTWKRMEKEERKEGSQDKT